MKRIIIAISFILGTAWAFGQDTHFSQTAEIPLLINPGATGAFDGWERVIVNHRNQWLGANTQFMTTNLAVDFNLLKSMTKPKAHLGLGLNFYNDIGGDAKFGTRNLALNVSGIVPFNKSHQLSAGVQIGFGQRSGDISKLYWGSQFNGQEFNSATPSGEIDQLNSFMYPEVGAGIYYRFSGGSSSFARNNNFGINAGFSMFHINKPKLQFRANSEERLDIKYVIHADMTMDFAGTDWGIDVNLAQFIQGPHYETLFGAMLKYRFSNGGKITTFKQDAYFGIGASYRVLDAFIAQMQFSMKGFRVGLSYDVTASKLRQFHKGGSIEVSLSYTNMAHALFKRRRAYK